MTTTKATMMMAMMMVMMTNQITGPASSHVRAVPALHVVPFYSSEIRADSSYCSWLANYPPVEPQLLCLTF
jgi:hypothetical protein